MTQNIEIRSTTKADIPLILSFIKELALYEKLLDEVVATKESLEKFLFNDKPYAKVVIAYLEGKPVGFALYFNNFSTFLGRPGIYLEDLYVRSEARGCGIGKKLLSYLAHIAFTSGFGRLEWWVLDWNQDALDFYKRLGAVPMDEWTVQRVSGMDLEKLAKTYIV